MIIDGHAHACGEFGDPEKLIALLNELQVEKVVLCPGGGHDTKPKIPKISYSRLSKSPRLIMASNRFLRFVSRDAQNRKIGNDFVYSLVEKYPERIIQFYWTNPLKPDFIHEVEEALKRWKIRGIKLHQCIIPFKNDSPEMALLANFAGEHQLPVFIHLFSPKEARKLIKLARKTLGTNFILAHLIGLKFAAKYGKDLKNLYFDISPYYIISEKRIKFTIQRFGIEHVLLGSDTPFGEDNLKNNIEKIRRMNLSEKEKELILGKNIAKLLKLK